MSTPFGTSAYGGGSPDEGPSPEPEPVPIEEGISARLRGASALAYVEPPPPNEMFGEGTLGTGTPVVGRQGGSMATVHTTAEGLGTKVLAGSTARVTVVVLGGGLRLAPYVTHPNTREDTSTLPTALATLAAQRLNEPEEDTAVPRPTIMRQTWSSDVPISRPAPAPSEPLVDLGGFAFGPTGIMIPVVEEDVEAMQAPTHEGY